MTRNILRPWSFRAINTPEKQWPDVSAWIRGHGLVLLLIGVGIVYAFALFNHALVPSMEPRFAEVVKEMTARGQYLIPIKNGVPYIEYPPLYSWLGLLGHLAGLSIPAAIRLPGYVALLLWIGWLPRLQRRMFPHWPVLLLPLTAVALPGVLYNFFIAQSDSLLTLGTLIAIAGYAHERKGFNWELWGGVALATLAKGPVGMAITLPVIGIDLLLANKMNHGDISGLWHRLGSITPLRGLGFVLLLNAPWYLAAGMVAGWDFVRAVVIYQNFTRFLVGFDHLQPWWYYGKTIFYDFFPLAFLLPLGMWYAVRNRRHTGWRLAMIWVLWTLVFFSLSQSKQGKYILPAAPAIAMLALAVPTCWAPGRWVHVCLRCFASGFLILFATLVIFVLPIRGARLLGIPAYAALRQTLATKHGKLFTYQWPRSMELYELGAPLAYVRSARDLYRKLHQGQLAAGDYLLVNQDYLPGGHRDRDTEKLAPVPKPPYFRKIGTFKAEQGLILFQVMPGAEKLPVPHTPDPPEHHWWEKFDTD